MILYVIIGVLLSWVVLTFWVQYAGKEKIEYIGSRNFIKNALIVYNPDPIYNLDEQVCKGFAEGLLEHGISSKVVSIKFARENKLHYDLYVFCVNTYNWAPDHQTLELIKHYPGLENKNVVAITVGSGSTSRAKRKLEETIKSRNAHLMDSKTYWLLRPNDENRMKEKNNLVAVDMAKQFGRAIGEQIILN